MTGSKRPPPRRSSAAKGPGAPTGIDRLAHRIAQQTLRVQSGGTTIEMSTAEAVLMATARSAASGNSSASWLLLDCFRRADERIAMETAERRRWFADFRQDQARRIARAEAAGEDSTRILPHPDDIDPHHADGPRITGPATEEEWAAVLQTVRMREAWLLQHALDHSLARSAAKAGDKAATGGATAKTVSQKAAPLPRRQDRPDRQPTPATAPGDALFMAELAQGALPARLRRSADGMVSRMMELSRKTQRALLKETRAAWAAAGLDLSRGTRSPAPGQMLEVLHAGARTIREVTAPDFDPRDVEAVAADLHDEVTGILRAWRGQTGGPDRGSGMGVGRGGGGTPGGGSGGSSRPEEGSGTAGRPGPSGHIARSHGGRHGA